MTNAFKPPATLKDALGKFKVQKRQCRTCIYREDLPWDLEKLEDEVRDKHIGFQSYRVCHHSENVCCRGFWNRHKDEFAAGQIAQRLSLVEFVQVDIEEAADKAEADAQAFIDAAADIGEE